MINLGIIWSNQLKERERIDLYYEIQEGSFNPLLRLKDGKIKKSKKMRRF